MSEERNREKILCIQEVERSEHVKRILEDPVFSGAVEELKKEIFEKWRITEVSDTKSRENLWMMYAMLEETVGRLQSIMMTGILAAKTLEGIEAEEALEQSRDKGEES